MYINQSSSHGIVLKLKCSFITYKYPLYGWQKIAHMAIPVCLALMWLPCMVLNLIALLVYLKKSMRKQVSNLIILNTIIADLCTGLFSIPQGTIHYMMAIYFHKVVCPLYASFHFFGFLSSVVSFLMISFGAIDCCLAIFKPYFYSTKLAHFYSLYFTVISVLWIFSISIVVSSFFTPGFSVVIYFVAGQVLVILIHVVINMKLWFTVRKVREEIDHQFRIVSVQTSTSHGTSGNVGIDAEGNNNELPSHRDVGESNVCSNLKPAVGMVIVKPNLRHHRTQFERENRKSTKVTSFILMSLCVCYLPYFIIAIVWKTTKESSYPDILYTSGNMSVVLVLFKSVLNPIIYWYSMPTVKKQMKQLLMVWKESSSGH